MQEKCVKILYICICISSSSSSYMCYRNRSETEKKTEEELLKLNSFHDLFSKRVADFLFAIFYSEILTICVAEPRSFVFTILFF